MTRFMNPEFPTEHPGVNRFGRVADNLTQTVRSFDGARGAATLMLAALVSALLVVANEVIETWTEGHLLAAWIVMWAIAFAGLALFAEPARRLGAALRTELKGWAAARKQAAEDEKLWQVAMMDARVMADLTRSMNLSTRAQRMMRSYY
jgi:hypothetical protein